MMPEPDAELLRRSIKRYYVYNLDSVAAPEHVGSREFGYRGVDSGRITRHIRVGDAGELRAMLVREAPLDVFVSAARYLSPTLPMAEKGWLDADLVFDIDAKDLGLECRPSHMVSICRKCGSRPGPRQCGCHNTTKVSLPCADCIAGSKAEAEKLIAILIDDLGIGRDYIRVYFSGNEGFHLHVADPAYSGMGGPARAALANYVMFRGAIPESMGMNRGGRPSGFTVPSADEPGWRGRFARVVSGMAPEERAGMINQIRSGGYEAFAGVLTGLAGRLGAAIDPVVTADIGRVFRMAGTINGKSGMVKLACGGDLRGFDPYDQAVLLPEDPAAVVASCPVEFRLKGRKFGPYEEEAVEVPSYAAVYMVCKGLAHAAPAEGAG